MPRELRRTLRGVRLSAQGPGAAAQSNERSPFDGQFNTDDPQCRRIAEAAERAGDVLNAASISRNREMTSLLVQEANGEIVPTSPMISPPCGEGDCNYSIDPLLSQYEKSTIVGVVHAHGRGLNAGFAKFGWGDVVSFDNLALERSQFFGSTDFAGSFLVSEHGALRFLPPLQADSSPTVLGLHVGKVRTR